MNPGTTAGAAFARGLLDRLPRPPQKIAILRPGRLGDFLCATPTFRALRSALPEAELTLIGLPFARELTERSRALDRFVAFPGVPGIAEQWFDARRATSFFRRMQAERFDLAIQLYGSGVYSNPVTLLLGAAATAGFVRAGDAAGRLDAALPWPEGLHEVRRLLAMAEFLGVPACGEAMEFPLRAEDHAEAEALLAGATPPLIGVHPSAMDPVKRWPPDRFAAAAAAIQRRIGGTIVLVCGETDAPLARVVRDSIDGPVIDLAGRTTVAVLGAVMARLELLLSNDSGPAHIAYALGISTVTVFGGTDPTTWGPLAGPARSLAHPVACRPCHGSVCPVGYTCLAGVSVSAVVEAAAEVLRWA